MWPKFWWNFWLGPSETTLLRGNFNPIFLRHSKTYPNASRQYSRTKTASAFLFCETLMYVVLNKVSIIGLETGISLPQGCGKEISYL
jgi:hypothetical protein